MDKTDHIIRELLGKGKSYIQIARIVGLNSEAVSIRARKMGLRARRHKVESYRDSIKRSKSEVVASCDFMDSPLILAKRLVFRERLQERGGTFYVDNKPIKLQNIIIEANKRLKAWGMEQIGHVDWRV